MLTARRVSLAGCGAWSDTTHIKRTGSIMATTRSTSSGTEFSPLVPASTNPVAEVLLNRQESNSRPGQRTDGATVALVIEGGGMRGVVSGGMVTALQHLNLGEAFDAIVGTSAGALAGAYFLAGQAALGTSIYYEDLTGKEWLNYRRIFQLEPPLALDYLLGKVMVERKPLNTEAILASEVPLYAVAARWPDLTPKVLGGFQSPEELRTALHASARIPVAAGRPIRVGDDDVVDGAYAESIPIRTALTLTPKPTHVLALLTRPNGAARTQMRLSQRLILYPMMNWVLPGLSRATAGRPRRYADELQQLERMATGGPGPVAQTIQLESHEALVSQLEQDPEILFAGARAGAAAVHLAITGHIPTLYRGLNFAP
jgi:predicted patatin/cPLA2 family phospholipase